MKALPALRVAPAIALCALLGCHPAPPPAPAADPTAALFADPFAVEVLYEAPTLAEPISPRPNRFFGGWIPDRRHRIGGNGGRRAMHTAPGDTTIQVVVTEAGPRSPKPALVLDLAHPRGAPRPAHVALYWGAAGRGAFAADALPSRPTGVPCRSD